MMDIVILAIGDKHYANWAFNLAVSMKFHGVVSPIVLIYDDLCTKHFKSHHWKVFDKKVKMDNGDIWKDGRLEPGRAKLSIYKYLEAEHNMFIDADTLCVKNPEPLLEELSDHHYVCQRVGEVKKTDGVNINMLWQSTEQIWSKYNFTDTDVLPATNTSFQYIRKCKESEELYRHALENINDAWNYGELNLQWGRSKAQPDELYMNIALVQTKTDIGNYTPIHFTRKNLGDKPFSKIVNDHYFIGYWGDSGLNSRQVKDLYDKLMSKYSVKVLKRYHEFKLHHLIKNKFLLMEKRSA